MPINENDLSHGHADYTKLLSVIHDVLETELGDHEKQLFKYQNNNLIINLRKMTEVFNVRAKESGFNQNKTIFSVTDEASHITSLRSTTAKTDEKQLILSINELINKHINSCLENNPNKLQIPNYQFNQFISALSDKKIDITEEGFIEPKCLIANGQFSKSSGQYKGIKVDIKKPTRNIAQQVVTGIKSWLKNYDLDEEDVEDFIEEIDDGLLSYQSGEIVGNLFKFIDLIDQKNYGRLKREISVDLLRHLANNSQQKEPIIYANIIERFNAVIQGRTNQKLDNNALLVKDFGSKKDININLRSIFSTADAFTHLPIWPRLDDLIEEKSDDKERLTTVAAHTKLNGAVTNHAICQSRQCTSVVNFLIEKLNNYINTYNTNKPYQHKEFREAIVNTLQIIFISEIIYKGVSGEIDGSDESMIKAFIEIKSNLERQGWHYVKTICISHLQENLDWYESVANKMRSVLSDGKLAIEFNKTYYFHLSGDIFWQTDDLSSSLPDEEEDYYYLKDFHVSSDDDSHHINFMSVKVNVNTIFASQKGALTEENLKAGSNHCNDLLILTYPSKFNKKNQKVLHFMDQIKSERAHFNIPCVTFLISNTDPEKELTPWSRLCLSTLVYFFTKNIIELQTIEDNKFLKVSMLNFYHQEYIEDSKINTENFLHDLYKTIEASLSQKANVKTQGLVINDQFDVYKKNNALFSLAFNNKKSLQLKAKPETEKWAMIVSTSRVTDTVYRNEKHEISSNDGHIEFGRVYKINYEQDQDNQSHFYSLSPVTSFMENRLGSELENSTVLYKVLKELYQEGYQRIIMLNKVPFAIRIGGNESDQLSYTTTKLLNDAYHEMDDLTIYPLLTDKMYVHPNKTMDKKQKYPLFIPKMAKSSLTTHNLQRILSMLTAQLVGKKEKHIGICNYFLRLNETNNSIIDSKPVAHLLSNDKSVYQDFYSVIKLIHLAASEKFTAKSHLSGKVYPFENVIGNNTIGKTAETMQFKINYKGRTKKIRFNLLAYFARLQSVFPNK